jgi:hypothetical protein
VVSSKFRFVRPVASASSKHVLVDRHPADLAQPAYGMGRPFVEWPLCADCVEEVGV